MSSRVDFRWRAREHLEKARQLLAAQDIAQLRYACLELRMCIEALTYSRLEVYFHEVSNEVMKLWALTKIIEELLAVDPYADKPSTLAYGIEEEYGVPAKEMKLLGEDYIFSMKWVKSAHNALGSFLHTPTFAQIEQGKEPDRAKIRRKADEIIQTLERVLASPIYNVRLGSFYTFSCECGFNIKRSAEVLHDPKGIICAICGAIYDCVNEQDGSASFQMRTAHYDCYECKTRNEVRQDKLQPGLVLVCEACGAKSRVQQSFQLVRLGDGGGDRATPEQEGVADTQNALHEHIRQRAYEIWEQEGRPEGHADAHWFRAELELRTQQAVSSLRAP